MGKKVIIVGAGIGGLGTAIQLAKAGMEVTIFEKNSAAGGRCQTIKKDGHFFDTGPTMYLFPQIYGKFFNEIGERVEDHLELLKVDPTYKLNFSDGSELELTANDEVMKSQLEKIENGSFANYKKYLAKSRDFMGIGLPLVVYNPLNKPGEYFNLKNIFILLKSLAVLPHYFLVSRYFKDSRLRAAFTFQDSYLSLHPYKAPSIFGMFLHTELRNGSYLPKGGMFQVINALENIAFKNGVKIVYNSTVDKVELDGGTVSGVRLKNQKFVPADYVVLNTDLCFAYEHLLPKEDYTQKLLSKKYSCSALAFHWGVDKVYNKLRTHNLFFSENYKAGFDSVVDSINPPLHPHFYIQAPSRTDKTRAPQHEDTLSVMVPINHVDINNPIDWDKYKNEIRSYIISRLEKSGYDDLEKHIKFEICHTPLNWQNDLNLTWGAVYGLHHNLSQIGYLREKRQHQKYENLFFVGASNHPGSGLPTVLISSIFTSKKILESTKN